LGGGFQTEDLALQTKQLKKLNQKEWKLGVVGKSLLGRLLLRKGSFANVNND
jgi:hypothetical protein